MSVEKYFYNGGLNCAESVIKSLIEDDVLDLPESAVKMMTGFGGGMQRGNICGAVVAAVAAIGAKYGRSKATEDRTPSSKLVREFLTDFEEKYGALTCKELRALNPAEHKSDAMYRSCTPFVEYAAEYVKNI